MRDPRGQLTGVRDHSYDALGRLVETRGPGGVAQRRSYTAQGFLGRVDTALASGGTESITYSQYDATGLPGRIVTSEGTTQLVEGYGHFRTSSESDSSAKSPVGALGRVDLAFASGLGRAGRRDPQLW